MRCSGWLLDDGDFFEVHEEYRAEHHRGFRASERALRRDRGAAAGGAGGGAGHRCFGEGRPLRPLLRLLSTSRSSPSWTSRASCPVRGRSMGASSATERSCCTHTSRPRCRRSRSSPKGIRRSLHGDEQQGGPGRHQPGVAERRDRGDGPRGSGQHRLQGCRSRRRRIRTARGPP